MADTIQTNAAIAANNPTRIADPVAAPDGWEAASGQVESMGRALYESPSFKGAVKGKDEMLQELFAFDQDIEKQYTSPTEQQAKEMYGEDYVPYPMTAISGSAGYASGLGGAVGKAQGAIGDVSGYYESAMSKVLSEILGYMNLTEKRKTREQDQKNKESERLLDILQITGGDWTDPATGEVHHIPSAASLKAASGGGGTTPSDTRAAALKDVQGGQTVPDYAEKYGGTDLEDWELINIYNENSRYDSMKESPGEFKRLADVGAGGNGIDPKIVDEDFAGQKAAIQALNPEMPLIEQIYEAKKRTISWTKENDPDNLEAVINYLNTLYPDPVAEKKAELHGSFKDLLKQVSKGRPLLDKIKNIPTAGTPIPPGSLPLLDLGLKVKNKFSKGE